jgi:2-dehydro-3-deoxygalactonokinase
MSFVAIDWGSSRFRAYKVEAGGVSDRITSARGILTTPPAALAGALVEELAPWRAWIERERVPVAMAGMIGSNRGLRDTGYQRLPIDLDALASREAEVEVATPLATKVSIRAGLAYVESGSYDVMRGEELQLLGADRLWPGALYVFPGTHSKWVPIERSSGRAQLQRFTTMMTGELYAWLVDQSLVCRGIPEQRPWSDDAFAGGVARASEEGTLLEDLFQTRARWLLGHLEPASAPSYLSGLLIGSEIVTMSGRYRSVGPVIVVGEERLCGLYARAMSQLRIPCAVLDGEAAVVAGFERMHDGR